MCEQGSRGWIQREALNGPERWGGWQLRVLKCFCHLNQLL